MNMSPQWAAFLTAEGIEATHWSEIGSPHSDDLEIIARARKLRASILTYDLDFGTFVARGNHPGPSVIQIRLPENRVRVVGPAVLLALRKFEAELRSGAILTIEEKIRCRILVTGQL